jgi:hypothetical protein
MILSAKLERLAGFSVGNIRAVLIRLMDTDVSVRFYWLLPSLRFLR